ncbi:MAG: nicotinate (nicotinamide) nucleotide adenylyltransferase [Candidatus Meridianibacter frigidus]|nr:MAG: nicotinate (nicotinamide) nucleotide adenylyltransferase [Candidatus Eremiobacteraeota bacterium]
MKIGIFGGTFDPLHNAHLFIAESARVLEKLDKVLFVPTDRTHYRTPATATAEDRCAMIAQAIASNVHFGLDRTDLREDATGYTADLLPKLRARYPADGFTLIIGADSLASNAWVRLDEILQQLETFAIAPRAGVNEAAFSNAIAAMPSALRGRVRTLNLPELPESATLIRRLLSEGKSIRYLLPEAVWRYIADHNLYGLKDEVA